MSGLMRNRCDSERDEINKRFQNLYCLIIDTSWYNWFPEYIEHHQGGINFPSGYSNSYIAIYRSELVQNNGRIFDHCSAPENCYVITGDLMNGFEVFDSKYKK